MFNTLLYVLRLLWFILRTVLIVVLVISLAFVVFVMARDTANAYIITTEGLEARAEVILQQSDSSELYKYFTNNFITNDGEITNNNYLDFTIKNYDYELKIESLWCRPWKKTCQFTVVETIPNIVGEKQTESEGENAKSIAPPAWPRRRYRVTCVQQEDAWLIDQIEVVESLPPKATPTKEPEITPTPEGMTPTPAPTPTA